MLNKKNYLKVLTKYLVINYIIKIYYKLPQSE